MTIHLKRINRFGSDSGGGGGGDVVIDFERYPAIWTQNENDYKRYQSNRLAGYLPFNVDRNKCLYLDGNYSGQKCHIAKFITNGVQNLGDIPLLTYQPSNSVKIANDDSFVIQYYSNAFRYIPINDYVAGNYIELSLTSSNYRDETIISSTRFALFDYTNQKILIIKLENGVLSIEKEITTISGANGSISHIGVFVGKLVVIYDSLSTGQDRGIRIVDIDTEEVLYEDIRTDFTNRVDSCKEKDNFLFVPCSNNSTPYVTTPLMIYEYSNGQFSKRNLTINGGFVPRSIPQSSHMSICKKDDKYIVITSCSTQDYQLLFCDMVNNVVDLSFYSGFPTSPDDVFYFELDGKFLLGKETSRHMGGGTYFYSLYYTEFPTEMIATQLHYEGNTFSLTKVGE